MSDNKQSGKKALKAGLGYTIGNIGVRGISFISMFIFARLLTVSDFGIYSNYNAAVSIFTIIVGLALHSSIKNANLDYKGQVNKYSSSLTVLYFLSLGCWLAIAAVFNKSLTSLLSLEDSSLVFLVFLESFGLALINFYNAYLAVRYSYKEYVILSAIYASVGIGLSLILILTVYTEERYMGRIIGTLVISILVGIYILMKLWKKEKPKVNTEYWKYALKISIPIIPHGLSQIVLSQFDRMMIKRIIGSTESGLYSFAYNIVTIFNVIASSLDTAWTQWFFERMHEGDETKIRKVANYYAILMALICVALFLISPELIRTVGGVKYNDSCYAVYPVLLAAFFGFMYYFPASIEYYYKKTKLIAVGTMLAALLNVILNLIYIPKYGYVAAGYTTLVCYVMYYLLHIMFARMIHGSFLYDLKIHGLIILFVSAMALVCLKLVNHMWIRLVIFCAGFLVLLIGGIIYRNTILGYLKEFRKK